MIATIEGHSTLPADALDSLTADYGKRFAYRHDTYFREGLAMFGQLDALDALGDFTFVVLKPDAVAGRRCRQVLGLLAEAGWKPAAATTVRFDPVLTREIWRYQFNAASDQRIAVVDHLLGSGPSLLVLLRDVLRSNSRELRWLPSSVRLTAAKGAADPASATAGDLRSRIGRVNGLLNFVHTADDPADVVRELRLFCYRAGTSWLGEGLRQPANGDGTSGNPALEILPDLEALIPAHDLDVRSSLRRLAVRDDPWGVLARDYGDRALIDHWLDALAATSLPTAAARWDVLVVVTSWIECNAPDVAPILATACPDDWHAMAGRNGGSE